MRTSTGRPALHTFDRSHNTTKPQRLAVVHLAELFNRRKAQYSLFDHQICICVNCADQDEGMHICARAQADPHNTPSTGLTTPQNLKGQRWYISLNYSTIEKHTIHYSIIKYAYVSIALIRMMACTYAHEHRQTRTAHLRQVSQHHKTSTASGGSSR